MLKITRLFNKSAPNKNDSNRPVFSKNNGNRSASGKNVSNSEIGSGNDGMEHAKKSRKLKAYFLRKKP